MVELTEHEGWRALKAHKEAWQSIRLQNLFEENPERAATFSFQVCNILFDFSKNYLTDKTLKLLVNLACQCHITDKVAELFSGAHCNSSEDKPALHMNLRHLDDKKSPHILAQLEKMRTFVSKVHSGEWLGYSGKPITDVIHVGVGGSLLGPKLVIDAFANQSPKLQIHFVSTIDSEEAALLLERLNIEATLFVIASKSFTTDDTICNASFLKAHFNHKTESNPEAFAKHFIGVSANQDAMSAFGIHDDCQFLFWDFVGGRYSVWSTVGLSIALAFGMAHFESFLQGAAAMDEHFQTTPLEANVPVIMGLLTVWYRNFLECTSQVNLPYTSYLKNLPAYLQQLEMESCGKSVTNDNQAVHYHTGGVIWGDVGSDGEHAFFQLLHQGTELIPADFIVPIQSAHHIQTSQNYMLAHALGQAKALMEGKIDIAHKSIPGNKPSTLIIFPKLTPEVLGALIACYEHKVFVQSMIWNINPFDQAGVELGKRRSKSLLPYLSHAKSLADTELDASTEQALQFIHKFL